MYYFWLPAYLGLPVAAYLSSLIASHCRKCKFLHLFGSFLNKGRTLRCALCLYFIKVTAHSKSSKQEKEIADCCPKKNKNQASIIRPFRLSVIRKLPCANILAGTHEINIQNIKHLHRVKQIIPQHRFKIQPQHSKCCPCIPTPGT